MRFIPTLQPAGLYSNSGRFCGSYEYHDFRLTSQSFRRGTRSPSGAGEHSIAIGSVHAARIRIFTLTARPNGWMLIWEAAFHADERAIDFGDQEEMGFGARVASPFTEQNGGMLSSSTGKKTAKETWGQPAAWCDYSGTSGERSGGILLMLSAGNFRESWWHNRDDGVFVANPFGREAMKQGARSTVTVAKGETFRIAFGDLGHQHETIDLADEYKTCEKLLVADEPNSNNR